MADESTEDLRQRAIEAYRRMVAEITAKDNQYKAYLSRKISGKFAGCDLLPGIASGLKKLADTSFEATAFEAEMNALSWPITKEDDYLWAAGLTENSAQDEAGTGSEDPWFELQVNLNESNKVETAIFKILNWEDCDPDDYDDESEWNKEKQRFNTDFELARKLVEPVLGTPTRIGQDNDDDAHYWAIWQGQTGLLILQQCAFDLQFGMEINFWLCPWRGPLPESLPAPLIDWLTCQPALGHGY